jgi:hypothetical protein
MIRNNRTKIAAISSLVLVAGLVSCAEDVGTGPLTDGVAVASQQLAAIGSVEGIYYDVTRKISIQVVKRQIYVDSAHPKVNCAPDSTEWVLVGGGADVVTGYGSRRQGLLVGAYPSRDSTGNWTGEWNAESKDHSSISSAHQLNCIAFGLKIRGATANQIRSMMQYGYGTSYASTGSSTAYSPTFSAGYKLVGGGARSVYTGDGRLLTASAPSGNIWYATTKDHSTVSSGMTEVFAAAINEASLESLVGYDIDFQAGLAASAPNATGFVTVSRFLWTLPDWSDYAATAIGGATTYGGAGRLLTSLNFSMVTIGQFRAISKDHAAVDAGGTTYLYAVGLKAH